MIGVKKAKQPSHFQKNVRTKGLNFLSTTPAPTAKEWTSHSYWRNSIEDLHDSYAGICSYTCHWIPMDTGSITVDHFLPKDIYPKKAYSWSNFRLACGRLNGRKGTNVGIDPFKIKGRWFELDFPSLLVKVGRDAPPNKVKLIDASIEFLKLNDEASCVQSRAAWIKWYVSGHISFEHLKRHAPFLASELSKQRLKNKIKTMMQ